jgi:hypothetical protein
MNLASYEIDKPKQNVVYELSKIRMVRVRSQMRSSIQIITSLSLWFLTIKFYCEQPVRNKTKSDIRVFIKKKNQTKYEKNY